MGRERGGKIVAEIEFYLGLQSNPDLSASNVDGSGDRLKSGKIKLKEKPNRPQLEYRFQVIQRIARM